MLEIKASCSDTPPTKLQNSCLSQSSSPTNLIKDSLTSVKQKRSPGYAPDSKTQVTVEYRLIEGVPTPIRVHTVVISTQHAPDISLADLKKALIEQVVDVVIPENYRDDKTILHMQPSGKFIIGGPQGDAGVTGRKIIVDRYDNYY